MLWTQKTLDVRTGAYLENSPGSAVSLLFVSLYATAVPTGQYKVQTYNCSFSYPNINGSHSAS